MKKPDYPHLYRVTEWRNYNDDVVVSVDTHAIVRETPGGFWVLKCADTPGNQWPYDNKEAYMRFLRHTKQVRFVLKGGHKRFAYPDIPSACASYLRRKERHVAILKHKLETVTLALQGIKAGGGFSILGASGVIDCGGGHPNTYDISQLGWGG